MANKPDWQLFAERHYLWNYLFGILTTTVVIGYIRTQMVPMYLDDLLKLSPYEFLRAHPNGLIGVMMTSAYFLQFVSPMMVSNSLETRERKKPAFWIMAAVGTVAFFVALFLAYFLSDRLPTPVFFVFSLMWMILFFCMGCMIVPMNDMFGKAIPSASRNLFLGIRFFIGSGSTFLCGLAISHFLKERGANPFREDYSPIFLLAIAATVVPWIAFGLMREPVHPVRTERKKSWGYLKGAARLMLLEDKTARAFCIMRALQTVGELARPLITLFMIHDLNLPRHVAGRTMTITQVVNAVAFIGFGLLGKKFGSKFLLQIGNVLGALSAIALVTIPITTKLLVSHMQLENPLKITEYLFILGVALNYLSYSGINIGKFNYPIDIAPATLRPTYIGFTTVFIVPFILFQNLGGAIADAVSYRAVFAFGGVFFALAIVPGFWMKSVSKRGDVKEQ